jgi:hypothetical protein
VFPFSSGKSLIDYLILRLETYPHDGGTRPGKTEHQKTRMLDAMVYLTEHVHEAPALIAVAWLARSPQPGG